MSDTIKLRGILMEDFCNYQKPSMFLITSFCNWKCCVEKGLPTSTCQNEHVAKQPIKEFNIDSIYKEYINNPITKAIVIGGLEPLNQPEEVGSLIDYFRHRGCNDDIVIFTGYTEDECNDNPYFNRIISYPNIIFKFGRYVPNQSAHYDEVLGINLISDNQYGKKYNNVN